MFLFLNQYLSLQEILKIFTYQKKFQYSKNDLAEEYNKIDSIDFINKNYSDLVFSDPYLANENLIGHSTKLVENILFQLKKRVLT